MDGLFLFSEIYFRKDVVPDMGAKMKKYSSPQEEVLTEGNTNTQVDEIKNLRLNRQETNQCGRAFAKSS